MTRVLSGVAMAAAAFVGDSRLFVFDYALRLLRVLLLLALMGGLANGGLTRDGLVWWGWLLVTFLGAAFVALQTIGLVPLVLNAASPVTHEADGSSDRLDRP